MIGLLLKDFMCIRKAAVLMLLVGIVISFAFNTGREAVVMIPTVICASLVGTAQAYDDEAGWYSYAAATGIPRRSLVAEKYVLGLMTTALGIIGGLVALLICNSLRPWDIDYATVAGFMLLGLCGGFLTMGLSLYVDQRFGSGYLGIVFAISIGAIAGLASAANHILDGTDVMTFILIVSAGIIVLDAAMFILNIRMIEKKDF